MQKLMPIEIQSMPDWNRHNYALKLTEIVQNNKRFWLTSAILLSIIRTDPTVRLFPAAIFKMNSADKNIDICLIPYALNLFGTAFSPFNLLNSGDFI